MIRPFWLGLVLAACGPFALGFLSSDLSFAVVFAVLFFLGHRLIRPFDWPRGLEVIQNTGIVLLLSRAVIHGVQAGLLLLAGVLSHAAGRGNAHARVALAALDRQRR